MSLRPTILAKFQEVADKLEKTLLPIEDDTPLLETGLDSLCFAIIVAHLEDDLGLDPFSASEEVDIPITVGDFVRLYDDANKQGR